MATIPVPTLYPKPMAWNDRARNGKIPDWRLVSTAVSRTHFALARCRKLVFHKTTSPGSTPQSTGSTIVPWRWQFRTGEATNSGGTVDLYATAMVLPADNTSGTNPRWRIFAGANNSDYRNFPAEVASPTYADISAQVVTLAGLTANTQYQCGIQIEDQGRVIALDVWEVVPTDLNTSATYVSDHRSVGNGLDISDADHTEFATDPFTIWKHNGAHLFNLVPDVLADVWTTTSTSYVNMLDAAASTTVSASTPGVNLGIQYHQPAHTNNVNAVFAVYGMSAGSAGGDVVLKDSGATLGTLSDFGTSAEWKSVAVNLNGSVAAHKVDVQFKNRTGTSMNVYAVSLYEYEA